MSANIPYKKQIFICTNERKGGDRPCCGEKEGMLLVAKFKKILKDKKLHTEVRAQRTGCFDFCEYGPIVVVYPDGVVYGRVTQKDAKTIVNNHIEKGEIVQELLVDFSIQAEDWLPERLTK